MRIDDDDNLVLLHCSNEWIIAQSAKTLHRTAYTHICARLEKSNRAAFAKQGTIPGLIVISITHVMMLMMMILLEIQFTIWDDDTQFDSLRACGIDRQHNAINQHYTYYDDECNGNNGNFADDIKAYLRSSNQQQQHHNRQSLITEFRCWPPKTVVVGVVFFWWMGWGKGVRAQRFER